jgi:hypothetical protein
VVPFKGSGINVIPPLPLTTLAGQFPLISGQFAEAGQALLTLVREGSPGHGDKAEKEFAELMVVALPEIGSMFVSVLGSFGVMLGVMIVVLVFALSDVGLVG